MSLWLPCGLLSLAEPITVTVTVTVYVDVVVHHVACVADFPCNAQRHMKFNSIQMTATLPQIQPEAMRTQASNISFRWTRLITLCATKRPPATPTHYQGTCNCTQVET